MQDYINLIFSPFQILKDNTIPFIDISFWDLWIGFIVVSVLAIPLLKFIFNMSDTNDNGESKES